MSLTIFHISVLGPQQSATYPQPAAPTPSAPTPSNTYRPPSTLAPGSTNDDLPPPSYETVMEQGGGHKS